MSTKNYDDWAAFCGPKGFYDLDGDGHLDGFEAAMMIGDTVDEMNSSKRHRTPPPSQSDKFTFFDFLALLPAIIYLILSLHE